MQQNKTLVSCAYLGSVSYYQSILQTSGYIIEKQEHYVKQSHRNRCVIIGANGPLSLSIPVCKPSGEKIKTADITTSDTEQWQRIHWQAICSAYNSSPFFEYYSDYFNPFYSQPINNLFDFDCKLQELIFKLLKIPQQVKFTDEYSKTTEYRDCRDFDFLKRGKDVEFKEYYQVFAHKHGFIENASIIDLLFNEGPRAKEFLIY